MEKLEELIKEIIKELSSICSEQSKKTNGKSVSGELDGAPEQSISVNQATIKLMLQTGLSLHNMESARIDDSHRELVISFCCKHGIVLDDDFFTLGDLYKGSSIYDSHIFGKKPMTYVGDEADRRKYELLEQLIYRIQEYNDAVAFFEKLDSLSYISLVVENHGKTFDEDIDVKLRIRKECWVDVDRFPEPGQSFIERAVDLSIPELLFREQRNADIDEYSNYPKNAYVPRTQSIPYPFETEEMKLKKKTEEYRTSVEDIFCYEKIDGIEEDVICFKIKYLKQNTSMFFPSHLYFRKLPGEISYRIVSKHSPIVHEGVLMIECQ